MAEQSLGLLQRTLPSVVRGVDLATSSGCSQARKAMIQLHLSDKKLEYTDSLMVSVGVAGSLLPFHPVGLAEIIFSVGLSV